MSEANMQKPHRRRTRVASVFCCVGLILGATACNISNGPPVGETRTTSKTVPLGPEKSVDVQIKMGAGELRVANGASGLMNADFTYNVDAWKPEVRYEASHDRGMLTIEQPSGSHNYSGTKRYHWDIRLNNHVPMDMSVNMGAGKALLNLAGLNLNNFGVNMGAGEADIDLDGVWQHDLAASIHGGVGKLTLHLPSDVGVRATVQGGLGTIHANGFAKEGDDYTNSAYGNSKVNLNINIEGGIGEVNLMLGGGTI
jgi:N-terminal domain of toast_rack, DUF2154